MKEKETKKIKRAKKKKVSILIPNRNSLEMIQLCILSIRRYTRYSDYKIVVYDDFSNAPATRSGKKGVGMADLDFLRKARDDGWIELHENPGPTPLKHGGVLNELLNEICDTDYAIVMDSDIQVKDYDWLNDFMNIATTDPKIIAVVGGRRGGFCNLGYYRMPIYYFLFGLMNMKAYRDDMQVDWNVCMAERSQEPYTEALKDYYPPTACKYSPDFLKLSKEQRDNFDANLVMVDPGAKPWIQIAYYNPKGYKVASVPKALWEKHHHYGHISMLVTKLENLKNRHERCKAETKERFSGIKEELAKLEKK